MKKQISKWILFSSLAMIFIFSSAFNAANITSNTNEEKVINRNPVTKNLPEIKGGSEYKERKPVSNIILQQKYPETIVLRGSLQGNKVALTFDDGPDPRYTPQILDVLKGYNIPATFFVMGSRAKAYPDLTKRMISEGHIVGNHTYWHPNLVEEASITTLEREVKKTEDTLEDIIGYRTKLFRPPYGFLYEELVEKLKEMDYTIVGWSVDSLDWRELSPENIAYNVTSNMQPGAIILMHDGAQADGDRTNTIKSLRIIIPALKEQGFEFVTVPELLNIPYKK